MTQPLTEPPAAPPRATPRPMKRLIILSDGTWQTLQNALPTNVLNLALALPHEDPSGVQQLVFYDAGVGTHCGPLDRLLGGALGAGLDANVEQLYTFLAMNYDDGDEVYLFGFSRGAYTVRLLAGMIFHSGLARRSQVRQVRRAYELYRCGRAHEGEEGSAEMKRFRKEHGERVPIKVLACFDTVGALGLTVGGPLSRLDDARYAFHDHTINPDIEHAIHMVSLEETRGTFKPTLMEHDPSRGPSQVTQKYFWGGHSGVGGGDPTQVEQSRITFNFLLEEMRRRKVPLHVDPSAYAVPRGGFDVARREKGSEGDGRSALGRVVWSVLGAITSVAGTCVREVESVECLHESVAQRFCAVDEWRPAALRRVEERLAGLGVRAGEV